MLRLQYMQSPPPVITRDVDFPIKLRIVNETGSVPNLQGTVALTARLLESNSRQEIPGNSIFEIDYSKGNAPRNPGVKGEGKSNVSKAGKTRARLQLDANGEAHLRARILPTCNGIHYSGTTHTDSCYHIIFRPVIFEFSARLCAPPKASPPAPTKKAGKASKSAQPAPKPPLAAPGAINVLPVTSSPIEVVSASQARERTGAARKAHAPPTAFVKSGCTRTVEFAAKHLVIEEWPSNTAACTGAIVWDNALLLCRYMQDHLGKKFFYQKRVVDIGCGTGVVGLCASLFGAHAILTDLEEGAALADRNVVANAQLIRSGGGSAKVVRHCWGEDTGPVQSGGPIDIVVACEVVYNNEAFPALVKTLCDLHGCNTCGLLALRQRHGCDIERFLEMLGEHFSIESTPLTSGTNGVEAADSVVSRVKHPPRLFTLKKKVSSL
mmetsp:Transcript_13326/g.25448  ORF Transcript_13326/g.25448 Transcript_13326/m.25448 type:complete len:438 (-) Transcript_13326:214-1527(-)